MAVVTVIAGIMAVGLLGYLFYTLFSGGKNS